MKVIHCESSQGIDEEGARACHFVVGHGIDLLTPQEHNVVPHVCTASVAHLQDGVTVGDGFRPNEDCITLHILSLEEGFPTCWAFFIREDVGPHDYVTYYARLDLQDKASGNGSH